MYESETLFPSLFLRINFIDNFIFLSINKLIVYYPIEVVDK